MLKTKEKKKEEKLSISIKDHDTTLGHYQLIIEKGKTFKYFLNINYKTSSCGSLEIRDVVYYYGSISNLSSSEKRQIFDFIINNYAEDRNHIYFIDRDNGFIQQIFADLGFSSAWSYKNYNSENIVYVWCYNRWSDEEVNERIKEEQEQEEDDSW